MISEKDISFWDFYIYHISSHIDFLKVRKDSNYKSPMIISISENTIAKLFSNTNLSPSAEIQTDLSFFLQ